MRVLKLFFLSTVALLTIGCPTDEGIYIEDLMSIYNNSNKDVYFFRRGIDSILYEYPPTESSIIFSNGFNKGKDNYRHVLRDGKRMYIWLFDKEVIDTTPWEEVVANDLYLIRYDLTLKDLEEMNWTITYEGE